MKMRISYSAEHCSILLCTQLVRRLSAHCAYLTGPIEPESAYVGVSETARRAAHYYLQSVMQPCKGFDVQIAQTGFDCMRSE
jgi:hypothetical protein